jgi:hypothetical protein
MVLSVDQSELESNIFVVSRRASERASEQIVLSLDQSELDTNIIILVSRSVFCFLFLRGEIQPNLPDFRGKNKIQIARFLW